MKYSEYPILTSAFGIAVRHDVKLHGKGTLCMRCGKVDRKPWRNPVLVSLRKIRSWRGMIYGGIVLCDACKPLADIEMEQAHGPSKLEVSEIPPEYREVTWDDFSNRGGSLAEAIQVMREWYDSTDPDWLYLSGKVGTGKTLAACTLARQWLVEREQVRFIRSHDFFSQLRDTEFNRTSGLSVESLAWYRLLVFDDLGSEKVTDWTRSRLLALLEARHDRKARTIFTSNYTLSSLAERLGDDRVPSRLAQWCQIVTLETTDYRLEEAKRKRAKR